MNKPDYISYKDWELLNNKYSSKQLEEYFNKNYPYQYLIGNVDFCNNLIKVDEKGLCPSDYYSFSDYCWNSNSHV